MNPTILHDLNQSFSRIKWYHLCILTLFLHITKPARSQNAVINASAEQVRASERFWMFGRGAALDFTASGSASANSINFGAQSVGTAEGFATATDFNGNLLFYTSASQTYDRFGAATPNGDITGSNSATQGVIILPHLGNPDRYLTVYTSTDVTYGPNGTLQYSVFDINQNGGKGDLVSKNQTPHPVGSAIIANEMITYAPNATGDGFWIISGINNGTCSFTSYGCTGTETRIYAIEVKFPGGNTIEFGTPVISPVASMFNGYGSIEFNKDYSRALVLSAYHNGSGSPMGKRGWLTEVNFNPSTGQFSQRWSFLLPVLAGPHRYYYADYAPGEQFVFVSTVFGNGAFRYDITSADAAVIQPTQSVVIPPSGAISGAVRTGPNGRTYFATYPAAGIWELTNPDAASVSAYSFVAKTFDAGAGAFGLSQTTLGIAVDYGDAPETYTTNSSNNGPRHRILFNSTGANVLAIGTAATSEANGTPSTNADNDSDDGVASFPQISGGSTPQTIPSYTVQVAVVNTSPTNATLSGWIDWDNDGTFSTNEIATAVITPGTTSTVLTWTNKILSGTAGTTSTYARFRISTDIGLAATGPARDGEVEDYTIPFSTPLPVTLANFDVVKLEKTSRLSWVTTTETNSDRFEIERSAKGNVWVKIGEVKPNRESSQRQYYSFTDPAPLSGENLYRLRMVDRDETFAYSRIESLNFESGIELFSYPNPVSDRLMIKNFDNITKVAMMNTSGINVLRLNKVSGDGIDVIKLVPGTYILKLTLKDGTFITHKVFITR